LSLAASYDLETGSSNLTGSLLHSRYWHTATLLENGKVLVAGGTQYELFNPLASTELYDPTLGTWRAAGNLSEQRVLNSATLLPDGRVLIAGGYKPNSALSTADIYDPEKNHWRRVANLNGARARHTATLLRSGRVLVVGGVASTGSTLQGATELYDPVTDQWETIANATTFRRNHTATLLPNGRVLIAGGEVDNERLNTASLFNGGEIETGYSRFVPIVLSSVGAGGAFYTSELTLANRGAQPARLEFTYTATFGGGTGQASDTLEAGRQRVIPDAMLYLRQIGIPIPESGSRGGTLQVRVFGLSSPDEFAVVTRTTTRVAGGRAGLVYSGIPLDSLLNGPAILAGLRQDARDRSNVALQNAGETSDGDIALRLTVYSGDSAAPFSQALPDIVVPPGGFYQIDKILHSNGLSLSNGYVRIERVRGTAPYYAYGVVNDNQNSDGSFIPPCPEDYLAGQTTLTLPVVIESNGFTTELVAINWSSEKRTLHCRYIADAITTPDSSATFSIELNPREQLILPDFVQRLRISSVLGIGPTGPSFMGALFAEVTGGDLSGVSLSARTSTAGEGGGRYGTSYGAVPNGTASTTTAWIYGLQQTTETRSNLALVNTGEIDGGADILRIEVYSGETGLIANSVDITVDARGWKQIGRILAQLASGISQGYARVTRISGNNPFIAYAVVNDGSQPGERTGDGAFVASVR
ncbi:MAG TPA: kelch repeat-containing protein, partial [Terriglobia bacterium]|nr:kelch repeat-containing protein [Terriglobia bacterium]